MSFGDHLEELRFRLIKAFLAVVFASCGCFFFWKQILSFLTTRPFRQLETAPELIYTQAAEGFMITVKISLFGGIFLAMPIVLYQAWRFVAPGLFTKEKKTIFPVVLFSTFFFLGGAAFAYQVVLPFAFRFLLGFNTENLVPRLSISAYVGFIVKLLTAFGTVFLLPIFSYVLTSIGIINASTLTRNFRYSVIVIFVVAAIITPPDVLTQFLMAGPLLLLYGISIIIAKMVGKKSD